MSRMDRYAAITFSILGWLFGLVIVVDGISGIFAYVGSRSMGVPSIWTLVAGISSSCNVNYRGERITTWN